MTHQAKTTIAALLLGAAALAPITADAKDDEGIPVTIKVIDEEGEPIPTAVVRHPDEEARHRVNTFDGTWTDQILYLPDGTEIKFEKGLELELEISAPGYINERFVYVIKRRKNVVPVTLQKMDFSMEDADLESPVIQFGRDKPIDGAPVDPAN